MNSLIKYGQCKKIGCAWPLNKDKTCDKCKNTNEDICQLCKDGGFTISPCPHLKCTLDVCREHEGMMCGQCKRDIVSQPRKHIPFENIDQLPTSKGTLTKEKIKELAESAAKTATKEDKTTFTSVESRKNYLQAENIKCLIQSCKGKERCLEHCPCDCHSKSICCEKCSGRIEDENGFGTQYGCLNDNCKCHLKKAEDFWIAWVWVSRVAPWMRYSRFFDSKEEARSMVEPMKGTKLIRVKVTIYEEI